MAHLNVQQGTARHHEVSNKDCPQLRGRVGFVPAQCSTLIGCLRLIFSMEMTAANRAGELIRHLQGADTRHSMYSCVYTDV